MAFTRKYSVTIDHTKCGTADSTAYPVLLSATVANWATIANGGVLTSSSGYDLRPFSDSALTTALTFQLIYYSATTGQVVMRIQMNVSASVDTVYYVGAGNSALTTDGSSTSTWNSNYVAAYELGDGTTLNLNDLTSNGRNLTNSGLTAVAGVVRGGAHDNGSSYARVSTAGYLGAGSLECWFRRTATGSTGTILSYSASSVPTERGYFLQFVGTIVRILSGDGTTFQQVTASTNDTNWHYLAGSFTGTTGVLVLDGAVTTGSANTTLGANMDSINLASNYTSAGADGQEPGDIDQPKISNVARSSSWFITTYNNELNPSTFQTIVDITPPPPPERLVARIITYNATQYGLLAAQPNWDTEIKITLDLPTDVSKEAITFQESRRAFARSARYKMSWTCYLYSASDATEARLFLTRIRGEPVMVPLWPDQCELASAYTAGGLTMALIDNPSRWGVNWIVANSDFTQWEILTVTSVDLVSHVVTLTTGAANNWSAGSYLYPLIIGRLDEKPKPEWITDETAEAQFTIRENSAFTYRLTPATSTIATVGSNIPAFSSFSLWTIPPNFSRPLDWTQMPDVVYEHVGFLREDQQRAYDHRTARGQELEFYQNGRDTISAIEYFWRDRRATTLRFMIPTFRGDLRMLNDTPVAGNPTWIVCEKSYFSNAAREAQPGDGYIALIDSSNAITPYALSTAVDDPPNTRLVVATVASVGTFTASTTILSHLLLARFSEATLEWSYTTPYLATTRIKFIELPHEYATPPTALPEPVYLFIFTEVGVRTDLFTSYENSIVISSGAYTGTYTPAPFSFETVKVGLKLDQEKLQFKSFKFTGNPLNKMWPFALDGILTLEVVEVDATNLGGTPVSRFFGDVWSVDSDYKATAIPFGNLFDRKFPRFLLSVSDNYTQFSPPTQLSAASFKLTGTINGTVDYTSQTLFVTNATAHGKAADYFAGGWLETGTGVNFERRGILHSIPGSGSDVTLTIDRPVLKAITGQSIDIYPGYDGSIGQCDTVFGNRINFGGHPYIPNVNPGVKAITPKQTAGGKK